MHSIIDGKKAYALLICFCLLLYLPGLMVLPPIDRDEARFAQASKQMVESGDFVRINFQDEPRNKKPIGIYWLQSAAVRAVGKAGTGAIWPYRIPSVLGACGAVLLLFAYGRRMFNQQVAFVAGLLCAASFLLIAEAHLATTDAVLLGAVMAAQGALGVCYIEYRRGSLQPEGLFRWVGPFLVFWVAQGVGVLIKGPILPVISLLTICGLVIMDRDGRWLKGLRPAPGILVMLAIVAPWGIAIGLATKGAFFRDSIGADLLSKVASGQESHGFPPGYYLLLLPLVFWPGSLFLAPALTRAWKTRANAATRFCLAWLIPAWILFELVPTKLPHYVLPTYPALALLTAEWIFGACRDQTARVHSRFERAGFLGVFLLLAVGASAVPAYLYWSQDRVIFFSLLLAAGVLGLACFSVWRFLQGRFKEALAVGLIVPVLLVVPTAQWILPNADALWLSRSVSHALGRDGGKAADSPLQFASAGYNEPSLVFLLGKAIKLTSPDQAALFLSQHGDGSALIDDDSDPAFQRKITELHAPVVLTKTIKGFNYSKGKMITLRLYAMKIESVRN